MNLFNRKTLARHIKLASLAKAEAKIDGIVYELFSLTPDEIALLETSI